MDGFELKKKRCAAGYFTQVDMARAMGMKPENYRNRERGHTPFTADEVVKVCELLGMSLDEGIKILL